MKVMQQRADALFFVCCCAGALRLHMQGGPGWKTLAAIHCTSCTSCALRCGLSALTPLHYGQPPG